MKKIKSIEIKINATDIKKFEVRELTVGQLIELSQKNSFFKPETGTGKDLNEKSKTAGNSTKIEQGDTKSGKPDIASVKSDIKSDEPAIIELLKEVTGAVEEVVNMSCSFKMKDLKELSPSEVKEVYDAFLEVNETFLDLLEKMGVKAATKSILQAGLSSFLETAAI